MKRLFIFLFGGKVSLWQECQGDLFFMVGYKKSIFEIVGESLGEIIL